MAIVYLLAKLERPLDAGQREHLLKGLDAYFSDRWREVGQDSFLVAAPSSMVTKDVSEKLQVNDGQMGQFILVRMENYWGWASKAHWEWITNMRAVDEHS